MTSSPQGITPQYLDVGIVIRPHGVRGLLLVEGTSDLIRSIRPGDQIFLHNGDSSFTATSISPHRKRFLIKLETIDTRNDAEGMREEVLQIEFTSAEPLPKGSYYFWQLIGLRVFDEKGNVLGELSEIIQTGANDVYVVRSEGGKEILLPAIEQVIQEVDLQAGQLRVKLLPGLLD
jgi:16S rRNA processing protein RimM